MKESLQWTQPKSRAGTQGFNGTYTLTTHYNRRYIRGPPAHSNQCLLKSPRKPVDRLQSIRRSAALSYALHSVVVRWSAVACAYSHSCGYRFVYQSIKNDL